MVATRPFGASLVLLVALGSCSDLEGQARNDLACVIKAELGPASDLKIGKVLLGEGNEANAWIDVEFSLELGSELRLPEGVLADRLRRRGLSALSDRATFLYRRNGWFSWEPKSLVVLGTAIVLDHDPCAKTSPASQ
jgi:hypothetical protein